MDAKNWLDETVKELERDKSGIFVTQKGLAELATLGREEYEIRLALMFASFLDIVDCFNKAMPLDQDRPVLDWARCSQIFREAERRYPTRSQKTCRQAVDENQETLS